MASFGDLRSMIADRDWSRWYQIDLARLTDAPLEAAQEYVRPHIMAALWGVPVVEGGCIIDWSEGGAKAWVDIRVDLSVLGGRGHSINAGLMMDRAVMLRQISLMCLSIRWADYAEGIILLEEQEGARPYRANAGMGARGEAAQAEAVLMRCAALLARGWPVTLEHAKAAIQPRPQLMEHTRDRSRSRPKRALAMCSHDCPGCASVLARQRYDDRWGVEPWRFDSAKVSIAGHEVDVMVIDDPIRDAVQQMQAAQSDMVIGDDALRALAHHIERHPPIGYVSMGTEPRLWRAIYQVQTPDPKTEAIFGAQEPQRRSIIDGSPIPRDWRLDGDES